MGRGNAIGGYHVAVVPCVAAVHVAVAFERADKVLVVNRLQWVEVPCVGS